MHDETAKTYKTKENMKENKTFKSFRTTLFEGKDDISEEKKMVKIKLNPKKKIGYQITDVGPGGKQTVSKSENFPKTKTVKEDAEHHTLIEAGQAKLERMRKSHRRAWARGDTEKKDAMGVATYDKQTKEDEKDKQRVGSIFGMRKSRLLKKNRVSESTISEKKVLSPILPVSHSKVLASSTPMRLGKGRPTGDVSEELVGGQKRLDVNKNKRLDAQDFKILRAKKPVKEESDREAEARHKRLLKMDILGTFGDRDLRDRIRANREAKKAKKIKKP